MKLSAAILMLIVTAGTGLAQGGRLGPPAAVTCDRNDLTSFTGEVVKYYRKAGYIKLTIKTDEGTRETVELRMWDTLLLNAAPMKADEWPKVEQREGKLKPGVRATAWICTGGKPVLDWQPPAK